MHSLYYEAIIQLRKPTQEVFDFVYSQIYERKNIFISKEVQLKTGVDLYISDQRFARSLGARLKKAFGGTVVISRSLYGLSKSTGKTVYRLTVCYRLD